MNRTYKYFLLLSAFFNFSLTYLCSADQCDLTQKENTLCIKPTETAEDIASEINTALNQALVQCHTEFYQCLLENPNETFAFIQLRKAEYNLFSHTGESSYQLFPSLPSSEFDLIKAWEGLYYLEYPHQSHPNYGLELLQQELLNNNAYANFWFHFLPVQNK